MYHVIVTHEKWLKNTAINTVLFSMFIVPIYFPG